MQNQKQEARGDNYYRMLQRFLSFWQAITFLSLFKSSTQ